MVDASEANAFHGDVDHGLGDVDPLLEIAHVAAPPDYLCEGSLDDTRRPKDRLCINSFASYHNAVFVDVLGSAIQAHFHAKALERLQGLSRKLGHGARRFALRWPAAHDDKSQIVSPGVRILRVFGVFESEQQTTTQLSRVFYLLQAGGQILCCQDLRPEASDKLAGVASCVPLHANRSRAVFSRGAAKSMNARTLGATSRA